MKIGNVDMADEVLRDYREAKTAHDGLARFEYQREDMRDEKNEDTYGITITIFPITSNQPPVQLTLQHRDLEIAAIQIIKDAYEYHKKQVESL